MGIAVTIDLSGPVEQHVLAEVGGERGYADVAAYIQGLIRRDMEAVAAHQFRTVEEHLQVAFAAPESEYVKIDADQFLRQLRSADA